MVGWEMLIHIKVTVEILEYPDFNLNPTNSEKGQKIHIQMAVEILEYRSRSQQIPRRDKTNKILMKLDFCACGH